MRCSLSRRWAKMKKFVLKDTKIANKLMICAHVRCRIRFKNIRKPSRLHLVILTFQQLWWQTCTSTIDLFIEAVWQYYLFNDKEVSSLKDPGKWSQNGLTKVDLSKDSLTSPLNKDSILWLTFGVRWCTCSLYRKSFFRQVSAVSCSKNLQVTFLSN